MPSAAMEALPGAVAQSTLLSPALLEVGIPTVLMAAAAIVWVDPNKFPTILLVFLGLGFMARGPLIEVMALPLSKHVSEAATKSVEDLIQDPKRFDRLMLSFTNALQKAADSAPLRRTLKGAIVESMKDEELLLVMLDTIKNAIVKSSQDKGLMLAMIQIAKESLLEALHDKEFMQASVASLVAAMLAAAKDEELKTSLMEIATDSVSTALQDEKFISVIRNVIADTLSDGALYRAAGSGVLGAFMPSRSTANRKKSNEEDSKKFTPNL